MSQLKRVFLLSQLGCINEPSWDIGVVILSSIIHSQQIADLPAPESFLLAFRKMQDIKPSSILEAAHLTPPRKFLTAPCRIETP